MPAKRNDFTPEEEEAAVNEVVERNETIAAAAERLNLPYYHVRRIMIRHGWVRQPKLVPTYKQEGYEWRRQ